MKTIVVSAVNLTVGGTLTILRDCLQYLSVLAQGNEYRIVALVYRKESVSYPNIEYIEMQWPKRAWPGRLWCEYVTMKKISRELAPVYLWLSLHDTTPAVIAEKRAVYCHNPFPFYKWRSREWLFTPKIVLFSLFSKWVYRINIHKNDRVVVQQQWIKEAFVNWFHLTRDTVIVAPPPGGISPDRRAAKVKEGIGEGRVKKEDTYVFFYAASANSHKNFECLCQAAGILQDRLGENRFEVFITVKGDENGYARWLFHKWGCNPTLQFTGFLDRTELYDLYRRSDCLVFPSKVETWGLPITEFAVYRKPMLLADLPYAHETAAGCDSVCFFNPDDPQELADRMEELIDGNGSCLHGTGDVMLESPVAPSWHDLFALLLK